MPRPRSPEGKNENVCVKVSETLLAEIDAARGGRSRSDWGRDAFLAALGRQRRPSQAGGQHVISGPPPSKPDPAPPLPAARFREPRPPAGDCTHRLSSGAWCKTCQRAKP